MKRFWPSGRAVMLTPDGVEAKGEEDGTVVLIEGSEVQPLAWFFTMRGWQRGGRERRVPRTWLCLAVELQANKKQISVYSYMPFGQARAWIDSEDGRIQFHEIFPKDVYDNSVSARISGPSRPEIPAEILTSAEGKYWLAERRRWTEGFELPPKEFEQFMNHVQTTLKL